MGSALPLANADLYKIIDEDGQVIYTNTPKKGAIRLQTLPPSSPSYNKGTLKNKTLRGHTSPIDNNDVERKIQIAPEAEDIRVKILEDELLREEALLAKAKEALSQAPTGRPHEKAFLESEVADHTKNIREIQKALTKLRGS
jgi:hypothetical protein